MLCVSKTKRLFSLGWNKQWSWRHYFYFTNFFKITGLENLLNKDVVRYAARLKDSFIMEDMCYITRLWSFRHVQKRARAITRPKSVPSTLKVVMSWWVLKVEVEYILYNLLSHKSFGWKIWTTNKYCQGKCFQELWPKSRPNFLYQPTALIKNQIWWWACVFYSFKGVHLSTQKWLTSTKNASHFISILSSSWNGLELVASLKTSWKCLW